MQFKGLLLFQYPVPELGVLTRFVTFILFHVQHHIQPKGISQVMLALHWLIIIRFLMNQPVLNQCKLPPPIFAAGFCRVRRVGVELKGHRGQSTKSHWKDFSFCMELFKNIFCFVKCSQLHSAQLPMLFFLDHSYSP